MNNKIGTLLLGYTYNLIPKNQQTIQGDINQLVINLNTLNLNFEQIQKYILGALSELFEGDKNQLVAISVKLGRAISENLN